jgi:hypothetical protein
MVLPSSDAFVWVKAEDLFAAMNTPDSDNENRTRGYVVVSASI